MNVCPECRRSFDPWDTVCQDCGVELVRGAPPIPTPATAPAPVPTPTTWPAPVPPGIPDGAPVGVSAGADAGIPAGAPPVFTPGAPMLLQATPPPPPAASPTPSESATRLPGKQTFSSGLSSSDAPANASEPTTNVNIPGALPGPGGHAADPGKGNGKVFSYRARGADGVEQGEIEAPNQEAALALLRARGLFVSSIEPRGSRPQANTSGSDDSIAQAVYSGASLKARAFFFRQLATLIYSGIPVAESMRLLRDQTSNTLLKQVAEEAARHTTAGGKMSEVFRRHPRIFGPVVIEMVTAGEEVGRLDRFLTNIADYLEREYQVANRIKGALVYPAFVLLALIFLPNVAVWVISGPVAYFKATLGWVAILTLSVGGLIVLVRLGLTMAWFRDLYDQVKLALPIVGKVVRQFAMGKYGRTLAMLYGAGVPLSRAAEVAANTCGNRYLQDRLLTAVPTIQKGGSLSEAVGATGCFPPILMHMIVTGEKTGNIDQMVGKIAEFAEADANAAVDQSVVLILPVCVILLGIGVCYTAIKFYGGYFGGILNGS